MGKDNHLIMKASGLPVYVGAQAKVTRTPEGVKIWLKDYKGETEEVVAEAISDIIANPDGSLLFVLPDGRTILTDPIASVTDFEALTNLPSINGNTVIGDKMAEDYNLQEVLESGANIKTINGESLLGAGNIDIGGGEDVFIATRDVTTYAELEAAIRDDKVILVGESNYTRNWVPCYAQIKSAGIQLGYSNGENVGFHLIDQEDNWTITTINMASKQNLLTAGNGINIENDTISGTKVDVSKGATNIIEVEGFNASKLGFEFGEDVVLSASSPMLFGESRTLQEKLTAGDNITIENNTISADDEVLVAVYEQTSYADVKAAIDAHKAIVLDMPANNNQFCITFATYTNGGNVLMYAIYKMNDKATLMTVTLTPQNQWTISHTDLQDKLISGTNIKTINNQSILGSGNIGAGREEFIAIIESTSFADVKAAIDANKFIILQETANKTRIPSTTIVSNNSITFGTTNGNTLSRVTVNNNDVWTVTNISMSDKQDTLISGENIKTINNTSLLGSGNIDIQGGGGDVFVAERNVTSYADVVQAINDGKVVVVKLYNDGSILFPMKQYANAQGVFFGGIVYVGAGESYGNVSVKSDDTWTDFVGNNIYVTYSDLSSRGYAEKTYVDTADTNLQSQLGTLPSLTTTEKSNLVGAINEVNAKTGANFEVGVEKWYGTYTEAGVTYQVYSKVVKIDALPSAAGITNYPHGITGIKQILSAYGFTTDGFVLNAPRQNAQDNIAIYQVSKNNATGSIAIEVGKDRSSKQAYVCLIYAKNN